ncbi:proton-conducting transporter transmembrane domain-containing protein [Wolbachia endosymbiont of Dirofilaria (Dirofilaria) immitis]|uniref:proton-conducting transporter transmembrane domain-containing protein n=1 Tax=Wolbachia endosymbiont of Dirofilaria (Dirofilaria) immitis TaxID=1812115 RepID=UPI0015896847|nr:proton-conducting transporter membrane subunit [Wolbachia endosymbiont of Dirofilaria (Dirofilaria) immitis]QKX02561.1 cation:proton antiporter [Wolbachia endosymbiont of Dirofilaria (Dirofilaria) immitis]
MQFYKFSLLLLLAVLVIIVLMLPESLGMTLNWLYPVLNFDLSFRVILISFLLTAFLIVLPARNLRFSEMLSSLAYTVSSLCAILSKQIILVIIFYELMAVSASFMIAGSKDNGPAVRYACIHFFAGVILTAGLATQNSNLVIVGLLINCACFPFSFWVVDAYPAASLHGTTYLSLFATKVSFLAILLHSYTVYTKTLAFFGSITVIYSIIFASLEQNIRRFLCYNIIGQMGLLIIAGSLLSSSEKAVPVLILHIIFSLSYQSLLFVIANAIISQTKMISFSGLSKLVSAEGICALIAVLTMAGFPGTAGFISKLCIVAEIEMNGVNLRLYKNLYKVLNLLIYLSVGLKFLYYVFITKSKLTLSKEKDSKIVMIFLASICVIIGNPYLPIYNQSLIFNFVYNAENIWSQFNLLLCTTLLFIPLRKFFLPRISFKMDIDWTFRALIPYIALLLNKLVFRVRKISAGTLQNLTDSLIGLCFNSAVKLKEVLSYNSVSFVSASSLFLMSILLVLLCLNH